MAKLRRFKGRFNWYGEVHELWTHAYTAGRAKMNFLEQLVKILDLDRESAYPTLKSYFNREKDNWEVIEN